MSRLAETRRRAFALSGFARALILMTGWRRRGVALLAGACGALAMAPFDVVPAMIVPMTVAVWLLDGCVRAEGFGRSRLRSLLAALWEAAETGWWWGFGFFVAGLWWLGSAFMAEAGRFIWLLPFGVVGLPAYLALYTGLGFALARLCWSGGPSRIPTLAVALTVGEWLRGTLLTGFPWNEFGMALGGVLPLAQIASLIGLHGLTALTVLIAAAPATLADRGRAGWPRAVPVLAALLAFAAIAGFGVARLGEAGPPDVPGVHLRVMQPDLKIDEPFSFAVKDAIVRRYIDLSDRATSPTTTGLADATHLIWPESAFPFILSRDADALSTIGAALPPRTTLVTGAARVEEGPAGRDGRPKPVYYNAVQVVGSGGSILDTYDKVHLVPFGEFLPLESVLESLGVPRFVDVPGGFEAGSSHRLLTVPGLPPAAAIVCYEAIFSGEVVPRGPGPRTRPGLLLNLTNDSWFGLTPGPYQHFAQARLRAIEEGLPLVRAATTGISGIVDARGRSRAVLPLGAEAVIDGNLPGALPPTLFSRYSNFIPLFILAALSACTLALRRLSPT